MKLWELLFLDQAWAAAPGETGEHALSIAQLIFPLINFLIFLYLLKRYLLPFAREYLKSRREEIAAAVQEADEAKRRAEALLSDYQGRRARLNDEAREIGEALRAEGEREKAKLLAEADELAARIRADADFLADQELKAARQELRREIARSAEAAAEKLVQSHLTAADRKRMVADFISEVGGTR